jgi:hypothetical protein
VVIRNRHAIHSISPRRPINDVIQKKGNSRRKPVEGVIAPALPTGVLHFTGPRMHKLPRAQQDSRADDYAIDILHVTAPGRPALPQ